MPIETDVTATTMAKPGNEVEPCRILGARNLEMGCQAIGTEPRAGAMPPCTVVLRQPDNGVEVSAIDPVSAIDSVEVERTAGQVRQVPAESVRAI